MCLDTATKPLQVEGVFTRVHCGIILPSLHTGPVKVNVAGGQRHLPCHTGTRHRIPGTSILCLSCLSLGVLQWGPAYAEIAVSLLLRTQSCRNCFPFKAWSMPECSHAYNILSY